MLAKKGGEGLRTSSLGTEKRGGTLVSAMLSGLTEIPLDAIVDIRNERKMFTP